MKLALERIYVGKRVRPLRQTTVDLYAEKIASVGDVDQPITVWPMAKPIGKADHQLVAGGHRLAGAHKAAIAEISVDVRQFASAAEARLAEIDENLLRPDLSALERAVHLAARKRVYDELHPEAKHGGDRRSTKRQEQIKRQSLPFGFSKVVADAVGLSERSIRDAVALAEELGDELIGQLLDTPLADNASDLKALVKLPAAKRLRVVERVKQGKPRALPEALLAAGIGKAAVAVDEQVFRALVGLWGRASKKTKTRFMTEAGLKGAS
jgi:ParB family chromosome partitioning protein